MMQKSGFDDTFRAYVAGGDTSMKRVAETRL
jgi:hypothetical protein